MRYNLMLVDYGLGRYDPSIVHRMNVITGDYLMPVKLTYDMDSQIHKLIGLIEKDMPEKIIFDKIGIGHIFYENFMEKIKMNKVFTVDAFGTIIYKDEAVYYHD